MAENDRIWERIDDIAMAIAGIREDIAGMVARTEAYTQMVSLRYDVLKQELDRERVRLEGQRGDDQRAWGALQQRTASLEQSRARLLGFAAGAGLGAGGLSGLIVSIVLRATS